MSAPVYLDYNASTPLDPRVWEAMQAVYQSPQVNSGSITHAAGRAAQEQVETARAAIAASISAETRDMIFCSGATEAINIALQGIALQYQDRGRHIVYSAVEHKAVLAVCQTLGEQGWECTRLGVDAQGYIDAAALRAALRPDTVLCAVQHVNNETGTIQDLQRIAAICNEADVRLFVDAAQSWGKLPVDVQDIAVDALCMSAHKAYGPQGIGALYLRRKPKRLRLQPVLHGGGQERALRPGTLPLALIAGMAATAQVNQQQMQQDQQHARQLRQHALELLKHEIPSAQINGDMEKGMAGTLNIQLPGVDAQDLLCSTPAVAMAMGSACTSSVPQPSHVLSAMGLDWQAAASSLRMSFGRMTTVEDMETAVQALAAGIPQAAGVGGDD